MNQEELRDYCLALPGVSEKMPFQAFKAARDILAFYVGGHIFCYFDIEKFDRITIKCDCPEELVARYQAAMRPYNMSPRYWASIAPSDDISDRQLLDLVRRSYEIVNKKK